ncbi:mCG1041504 [Mus musculus]|nr:mCG1041504 [Mus musculus]
MRSHCVALTNMELFRLTRLASNSQRSACPCLLSGD